MSKASFEANPSPSSHFKMNLNLSLLGSLAFVAPDNDIVVIRIEFLSASVPLVTDMIPRGTIVDQILGVACEIDGVWGN